ncbi:MAG TPA: TRAM domain-containing protein, partial [Spirochaetota bacterium]|nr:TRAM domain-containing protein [Spirochaetota bacterium]
MKIYIENIAYGGYGVGRIDGKAVFVDYALPGDELDIEIYEERKNYSFAKCSEVLNPSDKRIKSPCPNFEICGGCSYLNTSYPDEIEFKKSILIDQLTRIASIELPPEIKILSGERYHYRSHSSIKCNGELIGFYGRDSNNIIPFPDSGCLLIARSLIYGANTLKNKDLHGDLKIAED